MKKSSLALAAMAIALLTLGAVNCLAHEITSTTVTPTCSGYTIEVMGIGLEAPAAVHYVIGLQPSTGPLLHLRDSIAVTPNSDGSFDASQTRNWSDYGLTVNDNYNLYGRAKLNTNGGNTVKIIFSPSVLSCKVTANACLPTSSLAVLLQGTNVSSYVPNGAWDNSTTGLQVVPLEGVGTTASVATPNAVNSCSSNSTTGQTVCTANNTDVYLLTGNTLGSTLTSSADTTASFSGGACFNCGVAVNNSTNQAVLTIGLTTAPSASALQILDLGTNIFETPVSAFNLVSEDVSWDPNRNLILSPNEQGTYDIFQTVPSFAEFGNFVGGTLDSAGEDCTTGIALSTIEFTDELYIADLTQATFVTGFPGSWSGASQVQVFPEFSAFSAGTSGIAVAPGVHLGIVAGEFGGNQFGVIQLPSTSGSGIPSVVDYAAATLPNTPDNNVWSQGLDPHTITAYVSPSSGKAYGLMANAPPPTYLAVIDLQGLLSAPRLAGTHTVDPTYDLIANGVVRYVATH